MSKISFEVRKCQYITVFFRVANRSEKNRLTMRLLKWSLTWSNLNLLIIVAEMLLLEIYFIFCWEINRVVLILVIIFFLLFWWFIYLLGGTEILPPPISLGTTLYICASVLHFNISFPALLTLFYIVIHGLLILGFLNMCLLTSLSTAWDLTLLSIPQMTPIPSSFELWLLGFTVWLFLSEFVLVPCSEGHSFISITCWVYSTTVRASCSLVLCSFAVFCFVPPSILNLFYNIHWDLFCWPSFCFDCTDHSHYFGCFDVLISLMTVHGLLSFQGVGVVGYLNLLNCSHSYLKFSYILMILSSVFVTLSVGVFFTLNILLTFIHFFLHFPNFG